MGDETYELYLHIPFCVRKCPYCDFLSAPSGKEERKKYVEAMEKEMDWYGPFFSGKKARSIFIGGGTPSVLEPDLFSSLIKKLFSSFSILPDAEITVEVNPGTVDEEKLYLYHDLSINRLSIGLQSGDPVELKTLGRIHTVDDFLKTWEAAGREGFQNKNIDLMTGVPGQTLESLRRTLDLVLSLRPAHISAYDLIIEEGTPYYTAYHADEERRLRGEAPHLLLDEETAYQMTKMVEGVLKASGFHQYEISNFALPGRECLHNIGYWTRVPYLGLGLGAASFFPGLRWSNTRDFSSYLASFDGKKEGRGAFSFGTLSPAGRDPEPIGERDAMAEFVCLGLRMTEGILAHKFRASFGKDLLSTYGEVIDKYKGLGLMTSSGDRIFFTQRGREISNEILVDFMP